VGLSMDLASLCRHAGMQRSFSPETILTKSVIACLFSPDDPGADCHWGKIMMKSLIVAALASAALFGAPTKAQQTLIVGGQAGSVLRIGTEVPVRLRTELTTKSKALRVSQRFEVETAEPVSLNGHVVIPVGTPGVGEITSVTNKGMWGKSGHFDIRLLYLRVNDRQIRITGIADDKGKAGGVAAVAVSAIVFLPAGFFMTGTSARLPAGTMIKGFLDEDVPVSFADGATPAVLVAAPVTNATPTGNVMKAAEIIKTAAPR
jgi:hypothetical protein